MIAEAFAGQKARSILAIEPDEFDEITEIGLFAARLPKGRLRARIGPVVQGEEIARFVPDTADRAVVKIDERRGGAAPAIAEAA